MRPGPFCCSMSAACFRSLRHAQQRPPRRRRPPTPIRRRGTGPRPDLGQLPGGRLIEPDTKCSASSSRTWNRCRGGATSKAGLVRKRDLRRLAVSVSWGLREPNLDTARRGLGLARSPTTRPLDYASAPFVAVLAPDTSDGVDQLRHLLSVYVSQDHNHQLAQGEPWPAEFKPVSTARTSAGGRGSQRLSQVTQEINVEA
jgi:hypothetical protein